MISKPLARLAQTVYLSCVKINTLQMDQNQFPVDPRHVGVPLVASKMISEQMVHSAQTLHLFCAMINTISKWTETRVHLIHVT
jgi:hypothetical protein